MAAGILGSHEKSSSASGEVEASFPELDTSFQETNGEVNVQSDQQSESEAFRNCALGVKRFYCDECEFASFFEQTLLDHRISDHEGGLAHLCQRCDRRFKELQDVEHHILVEHLHPSAYWKNHRTGVSFVKRKNFRCDECGSRFNQRWLLNKHKKLHKLQRQCVCVVCELSFPNESLLADHAREVHSGHTSLPSDSGNGKYFFCRWCRRKFNSENGRGKHERCCRVVKTVEYKADMSRVDEENDDDFLDHLLAETSMSMPFSGQQLEFDWDDNEQNGPNKFNIKTTEFLPPMPTEPGNGHNPVCNFCDEVFEHEQYLKDHVEEMHQVKESVNMPRFPMMYSSDNHRNRMNGGGDSFKYSANGDTLEDGSHMSVSDMKTDDISFDHEDILSSLSDLPNHQLDTTHNSMACSEVSSAVLMAPPKKPRLTETTSKSAPQSSGPLRRNRCLICMQFFDSFGDLKKHVSDVHKPKANKSREPPLPKRNQPKKCLICKLMLPDIESLKSHVSALHSNHNTHQNASSYETPEFVETEDLPENNLDDSSVNVVVTDETDFPDFSEFESANLHTSIEVTHSEQASPSEVKRTPSGKDKQSTFKCKECNRSFKYKWNYDKDQEMHRKQAEKSKKSVLKASGKSWMLDCPHCSETFVDKIARIQHIKKAHEAQPKHVCDQCGDEFPRRHLLISHVETEHFST